MSITTPAAATAPARPSPAGSTSSPRRSGTCAPRGPRWSMPSAPRPPPGRSRPPGRSGTCCAACTRPGTTAAARRWSSGRRVQRRRADRRAGRAARAPADPAGRPAACSTPTRSPGPARHGRPGKHGMPVTCHNDPGQANPEPDETLTLPDTPRYGTVRVSAWHQVHPLIHGDRGWFDDWDGELPVLRGTVLRVTRRAPARRPHSRTRPCGCGTPGPPRCPSTSCGAPTWPASTKSTPSGSLKGTLGLTAARVRTPEQADRWVRLVMAAHAQLLLARPHAADLRRPWETRPASRPPPDPRPGPPRVCKHPPRSSAPPPMSPNPPGPAPDDPKAPPAARHPATRSRRKADTKDKPDSTAESQRLKHKLRPAGDDELTNTKIHHGITSRCHLLLSWAHKRSGLEGPAGEADARRLPRPEPLYRVSPQGSVRFPELRSSAGQQAGERPGPPDWRGSRAGEGAAHRGRRPAAACPAE